MYLPMVVTLSLLTLGLVIYSCGYLFRRPATRRTLQWAAMVCEVVAVGVAIWGFGRIVGR